MNRLEIAGALVLIFGITIYLIYTDEIPSIARAILIGVVIGITVTLSGHLRRN